MLIPPMRRAGDWPSWIECVEAFGEQAGIWYGTRNLVTPSIALVKQLPSLSVEPGFAHLLDRLVVRGTCVESDSGQ